jgi:hypothetical protein
MIITNSKGQRKEISDAEARLIKKQGISPDQFFELFPNEDNTNFAGMNIVDYDAFIDSDFRGIEEEPPPRVSRGVGGSQGKGYPTEEAMKAMREDEEYKRNELIAGIKRNDDKLALEQYMLLEDAAFYGDLAKKMFAIGMTAEGVGLVLAPALKTQQVAAETIKDVFATATKKVTVPGTATKNLTIPGTERIYKPYQKEEVIENLNNYIAKMEKDPDFVPGFFEGKAYRRNRDLPLEKQSPQSRAHHAGMVKKRYEREGLPIYYDDMVKKRKEGGMYLGTRMMPEELFARDVDVPIRTIKDIEVPIRTTKEIEVPVRGEITMESMKDVPKAIGKETAALFVPFIGNYSSIQEAEGSRQEAIKRQQELYNNASPAVKEAIDKLQ